MRFKMSPNMAVRTDRVDEAIAFYSGVLGLADRSESPEMGVMDAAPFNLFIIEDAEARGPVLELFVDDLEGAREYLTANGCRVLRWRGKGQDCYVEDPSSENGQKEIERLAQAGVLNRSAQHVDIVTDFRPGGCGRSVHVDGVELAPRNGVWEGVG